MKTTGRQWAGRTAVVGTVFIALGAFWLSFTALADLAARSGVDRGQAWAWPLIVDGIIVVATVAVVALAGQRSAWYPWSLLVGGALVSVTANAIHAVVAADADVPGLLAASVAAVPPVVLLAITHLTVILTRTFPQELPGQPEVLSEIPEMLSEVYAGPQGVVHSKSLLSVASEPLADERELSLASDETPGRSDRRARAAALRAAGWSNKRIAREVQVHPATVGRWFAAVHLPDTNDDAAGEREETRQRQPSPDDADGPRPAPAFVEWLMGLPTGWVTDSGGLTQNQQITALGNGLLPLQAVSALSLLAA